MPDVFYFTSPRKPVTVARHRPSVQKTPKPVRKRRFVDAEMFNQRACRAHYEEPTFCRSAASSLFVSEPVLQCVPASASNYPSLNNIQHDFELDHDNDDEEDETGGVALPPFDHDSLPDVHNVAMPIPHDRDTHYEINVDEDARHESYLLSITSSTNAFQHRRRSHPCDLWESVDGRRTRLAMDGNAADEVPRFDLEAVASHNADAAPIERMSQSQIPSLSTSADTEQLVAPRAPSPPSTLSQSRGTEPAYSTTSAQAFRDMGIDEDALAVDDPRRHYDVADFMDLWRLLSIADKRLPPFEPGLQPSVRLGLPLEQITRAQTKGGTVDMQGIRWQLIGPPRHHASIARNMLHPSGVGPNHHQSHQQHCSSSFVDDSENHYRFRAFAPQHKAKFEHYQLRNVLVAPDRNNIFYGSMGNKVMRASLTCPTIDETVMNLIKPANSAAAFRITCLSASLGSLMPGYQNDNVLVAGGFYGEYAISNVDSCRREIFEGFVTHAYNGLVTHCHNYYDRRSGLLRASFCSNDSRVRLMDLRTLQFTDSFVYDSAINCSATSADGRLRVLVGDSNETLITDAERGAPLTTLREHHDHGFACAWSQDGRHVATAAQDGRVVVWDARTWKTPLRVLDSVMSCARSLSFTDNGSLVAAENEDVVTVYDRSSFDTSQEIRFFGSIAGVALLDGGAELVVANADKTVGGLLAFERLPQVIGEGTCNRSVARPGAPGSWRNGRGLCDIVGLSDVLV